MEGKSKTQNKFDKFYNQLSDIPDISHAESDKFNLPDDEKEYSNYAKDLIITINSADNTMFERYTAVFKFYQLMNKLKEKSPDDGNKAKKDLLRYFPRNYKDKYIIIKTIIKIYHFFNSGLAGKKNFNEMILKCGIAYRDFRSINNSQWKIIIKKFEFENDYNRDDNFWRINRLKVSKEEIDEESDKTIESE